MQRNDISSWVSEAVSPCVTVASGFDLTPGLCNDHYVSASYCLKIMPNPKGQSDIQKQ